MSLVKGKRRVRKEEGGMGEGGKKNEGRGGGKEKKERANVEELRNNGRAGGGEGQKTKQGDEKRKDGRGVL